MTDTTRPSLKVAQTIRARKLIFIVVAVVIALTAYLLPRYQPYFFSFEHKHADLRTSLLSPRPNTVYESIVFVTITESELELMAYRSPIDRAWISKLITILDSEEPAVIAIDILFDQPTEPKKDQLLIDTLRNAQTPIVLATTDSRFKLTDRQKSYNYAFIHDAGGASGFVNVVADEDDILRGLPQSVDPAHPQSFADVIVEQATGIRPPEPKFGERIAWLRDLDQKTQVFPGKPANTIMLRPEAFNLKDKIILIGANLPSTDKHKTPFSGEGRVKKGESGSHILAQMIAQKLDGRRVTMLSPYLELILYLIAACAGLLIAANAVGIANKAKIFSSLGIVALLCDLVFFKFFSLLIPTAMILFTLGLAAGLPALYVKLCLWGQRLISIGGRTI